MTKQKNGKARNNLGKLTKGMTLSKKYKKQKIDNGIYGGKWKK